MQMIICVKMEIMYKTSLGRGAGWKIREGKWLDAEGFRQDEEVRQDGRKGKKSHQNGDG